MSTRVRSSFYTGWVLNMGMGLNNTHLKHIIHVTTTMPKITARPPTLAPTITPEKRRNISHTNTVRKLRENNFKKPTKVRKTAKIR